MTDKIHNFQSRTAFYVQLIPLLREVAKEHGYAVAIHGSMVRDLDALAVPWVENASPVFDLVKAIKEAIQGITHIEDADHYWPDCNPLRKPHGRMAYCIHFSNQGMYGPYLDLSVITPHIP